MIRQSVHHRRLVQITSNLHVESHLAMVVKSFVLPSSESIKQRYEATPVVFVPQQNTLLSQPFSFFLCLAGNGVLHRVAQPAYQRAKEIPNVGGDFE